MREGGGEGRTEGGIVRRESWVLRGGVGGFKGGGGESVNRGSWERRRGWWVQVGKWEWEGWGCQRRGKDQ